MLRATVGWEPAAVEMTGTRMAEVGTKMAVESSD